MNSIIFIIATLSGFYSIFKAIKALDKIYFINKHGIKAKARVINIREKKSTDNDGAESFEYYYKVKFIDNRGREIEREVKFGVKKNSIKNPPFSVNIIYIKNENNEVDVILERNEGRNLSFYVNFIVGIGILSYVAYNYDGQFDIILNFINNLFK